MSLLEEELECGKVRTNAGGIMKTTRPRVSVIVPTYYDWARLQLCVVALQKQSFSKDAYEVIIVNNAPNDMPPPDFFLPKNFRFISEDKPGSYAARNAALKIAKGEIIAFTDSDCIPDPSWLEAAVERLDKGAERIAGKVELFFKAEKLTLVEIYEKSYAFDQKRYAQTGGSATANMVTWAKHFETVGLFNDSLMSGGDNEWGWRATDKGIPVEYAAEVIVNHPARADIKAMLKKRKRVLGGSVNLKRKNKNNNPFLLIATGYLPPFRVLKPFMHKGIPLREKCLAALLCYYLKIFSTTYRLALLLRLIKPVRS